MNTNRRLVFPALLTAGVLWGTTVPLSKVALGWLPPAWLAFARFALAAAVLIVVSRPRLRAAVSPAILITGAIGYGGSVLLQNIGIERTSVTHAALLIGATPVLVAVLAAALGHSMARPLAWTGFGLSLAGVGFIAGGQGSGSSLRGDALVLAAQLISAGFTVSQARLLRGRDPIAVTGVQLMAAACAVLPVALVTEHRLAGSAGAGSLAATIGLVLAGTVLPTSLFAFGQSRVSADVAGAFLNLEPLVGAIMGVALFAEPAGPVQLAGGGAIMTGIGLSSFQVVRSERRRGSAAGQQAPVRTLVMAGAGHDGAGHDGAGHDGGGHDGAGHDGSGLDAASKDAANQAGASQDRGGSGGPRSLAAPGEAPSVIKRTRLPRLQPVTAARLQRRRFRPAGHPAARRRERSRRGGSRTR